MESRSKKLYEEDNSRRRRQKRSDKTRDPKIKIKLTTIPVDVDSTGELLAVDYPRIVSILLARIQQRRPTSSNHQRGAHTEDTEQYQDKSGVVAVVWKLGTLVGILLE